MSGRLEGKVAVITGGASGMGKSTALRFLDEGARVVVGDLNEPNGKELLIEVDQLGAGDRLRFIPTDVSQESDVEEMIGLATSEFGRLDIIFNNAGIGGAFGAITEVTVEDWDRTFAVMCKGPFLGIKYGARVLKKQGEGGTIINTASVAGLSGGAGPQAYSAAKAGVINLTRAASLELAKWRIRVNAICPGAINTPLLHRGSEQAFGDMLDSVQPWPDHGRGEHIAGAVLFLASEDSVFVTGQAIVVDGGLTAAGPGMQSRMGGSMAMEGVSGFHSGSTGQEITFN
ncbi:MAG: SDR family NAD(P)-dependent oxidoreductase [Acidimicrobiales bacterium]